MPTNITADQVKVGDFIIRECIDHQRVVKVKSVTEDQSKIIIDCDDGHGDLILSPSIIVIRMG